MISPTGRAIGRYGGAMSGKFFPGDKVMLKNRRGCVKELPRTPPEGFDYFVRFVRGRQWWYSWCAEKDLVPLASEPTEGEP